MGNRYIYYYFSRVTWSGSQLHFCIASKDWVIQPKPKPGRKPKKDVAPVVTNDEDVSIVASDLLSHR